MAMTLEQRKAADTKRLLNHIDMSDRNGCWPWTLGVDRDGYGRIRYLGQMCLVTRAIWELTNAPIPNGMHVCHLCDNPICANPDHLFVGTPGDNMRDKVLKERQARGQTNGRRKLTESDVLAIRSDTRNHAEVARAFGVGQTTVRNIRKRIRWSHVA